jgi:hypothetical protein
LGENLGVVVIAEVWVDVVEAVVVAPAYVGVIEARDEVKALDVDSVLDKV